MSSTPSTPARGVRKPATPAKGIAKPATPAKGIPAAKAPATPPRGVNAAAAKRAAATKRATGELETLTAAKRAASKSTAKKSPANAAPAKSTSKSSAKTVAAKAVATARAARGATYIVTERKSRVTGTLVRRVNLAHPDSEYPVGKDGNTWARICVEHKYVDRKPSRAATRVDMSDPTKWCPKCAAAAAKPGSKR